MTQVLYYDPFKANQGQVHGVRQYYELKVVSDTLLCGSRYLLLESQSDKLYTSAIFIYLSMIKIHCTLRVIYCAKKNSSVFRRCVSLKESQGLKDVEQILIRIRNINETGSFHNITKSSKNYGAKKIRLYQQQNIQNIKHITTATMTVYLNVDTSLLSVSHHQQKVELNFAKYKSPILYNHKRPEGEQAEAYALPSFSKICFKLNILR
ncbi:hypothetical protein AGLY_012181 [Aphis glycines]|uniref:Uncharacterized protein n=1 Tax=Aphis glycines TaxID=307491 RepID=A0A6G0T9I1_APHGL|nr:hypothetical protein AGLY_012181 [Aphis glycines]